MHEGLNVLENWNSANEDFTGSRRRSST
nr:hypothetical protein [Nonomuraea antri]